ncbi:MAG: MFS transporter, partial [Pseudomonadota bacterium]
MSATPETVEVLLARYGPRFRFYVILTSMLGTISAVLTTTTVNVALPDMMGSFGIGQDRAQMISAGALAGMTVGMLLNAWLMDSFGQRNTFVGALCVFIVALLVAGVSPNVEVLIIARVVQGMVAGVLQSLNMYTSFSVFPPGQRGRAMGFSAISVILGPAIGPTLGGVMIDLFNWRYIFYAPLPFCIAG